MDIIKIEKNKNILTISLRNGRVYKVDFLTGDITGRDNKSLKYNPFQLFTLDKEIKHTNLWENFLSSGSFVKRNYCREINHRSIQEMEKFIPYLDLIEPETKLPESIPAGYVKWCRENNEIIEENSYFLFLLEKANVSKKEYLRTKQLFHSYSFDSNGKYLLIQNKDFRKIFFTIIENDLKIFKFPYAMMGLFAYMKDFGADIAALNLGVQENYEIYNNFLNKNKNRFIIQNEDKIRDLEKIQHEKFCIVIPKTLQDFIDEGEQQRNCVGYHYHNSIARGENLIYFVRLKENPKKSLNTCRYAVFLQKTVENKIYRNEDSSEEVKNFIKNIVDPEIRKFLNK